MLANDQNRREKTGCVLRQEPSSDIKDLMGRRITTEEIRARAEWITTHIHESFSHGNEVNHARLGERLMKGS